MEAIKLTIVFNFKHWLEEQQFKKNVWLWYSSRSRLHCMYLSDGVIYAFCHCCQINMFIRSTLH